MKTLSAQLKTDLKNGTISILTHIIRKDGTEFFFTDYPINLTIDGDTYESIAGLARIKLVAQSAAEVSSQSLTSAFAENIIEEVEVRKGIWDDAKIIVSWTSWKNPSAGKLIIFSGRLGVISWTDDGLKAEVHNLVKYLQRDIGRFYTAFCQHILYDSKCQVLESSFDFTGSVDVILTDTLKFKISGAAAGEADGYFSNGKLEWTTGNNVGLIHEVKAHDVDGDPLIGESLEMFLPTPYSIQAGDDFIVYAGCDKTLETCKNKFNNVVNFGGFPFLTPKNTL